MNKSDEKNEPLTILSDAFRAMLVPCLEECAQGRWGLFGVNHSEEGEKYLPWPEADRARELALSIQSVLAQSGERDPLCDEFLDLCTIHGENDPGEPRLARDFLKRIDRGEVGTPTQKEQPRW
jgi:hypothetical protein